MLNQKSYFFQYTKSKDSFCRKCDKIIEQDELRVYRNDHYEIYPYPTNGWFHFNCFWLLEEEVKSISANDVMLEIDCSERNYQIGSWQYQWKNMVKDDIKLSLHDGQNTCFYTSLAFYDTTNSMMSLNIDEKDAMEIRKKIAEVKGSTRTSNTSLSSSSLSSGYASADDLPKSSSPNGNLTADDTYDIDDEEFVISPATTSMKALKSEDVMDYLIKEVNTGTLLDDE